MATRYTDQKANRLKTPQTSNAVREAQEREAAALRHGAEVARVRLDGEIRERAAAEGVPADKRDAVVGRFHELHAKDPENTVAKNVSTAIAETMQKPDFQAPSFAASKESIYAPPSARRHEEHMQNQQAYEARLRSLGIVTSGGYKTGGSQ